MPMQRRDFIRTIAEPVCRSVLLSLSVLQAAFAADLEREEQQRARRAAKRKRDELDLAEFIAPLSRTGGLGDVRSSHWTTHDLNGLFQGERFEKTFRMSKNSFNMLHGLLGSYLLYCRLITSEPHIAKRDTRLRLAVPSQTRLIAYLLYMTQGITYKQISEELGIGFMTVSKCVHDCTNAIVRHMFATYIRLPTPAQARETIEKLKQQIGLPGIYGVIDGTHILIKKPCDDGMDYLNVNSAHHSINIQGSHVYDKPLIEVLVDYEKRFLDVEIGWPGSVEDSRIFEKSFLNGKYEEVLAELGTEALATGDGVEEDIPAFILGDSAYKNSRHFVTTYKTTQCDADPSVRQLNSHLNEARYHVEQAFGLLKGRFKIFEKPLTSAAQDLPFSLHLITSICIVHNFLIDSRDAVSVEDILPVELASGADRLERTISEDDKLGDISEVEGGQETTREAFLRRIRWLDEVDSA
jgi:DDE superfamily endonuclease